MSRSKVAARSTSPGAVEALVALYAAALDEAVSAALDQLSKGRRPDRSHQADYSVAANGMPSLSDGWFNRTGPLTYPALLDPPPIEKTDEGRYPRERFPTVAALTEAVIALPVFGDKPGELALTTLRMQLDATIDAYFQKFGETAVTSARARAVVLPAVRALLETDLDIALVAPIALTRFDFRDLRISPNVFVMKMSPDLQRARWSGKAYGAKGHDSVMAAATHAFVVTGWRIDNHGYYGLSHALSNPWENATEDLDRLFAALRLVTGVETGYAQEIRLARGWRAFGQSVKPEVFCAPARKYPESFDDFSWTRDDIPRVSREQMAAVGRLLAELSDLKHPRLAIALRRLNAAATRSDPADAILDAVIGLEVLLGDKDNQSISWKLRMRASALAGLEVDRAGMKAVYDDISAIYKERSAIVHGLERKSNAATSENVRPVAVGVLRRIMGLIVRHPEYLDPLKIDQKLLLTSTVSIEDEVG